MPPKRHRLQRYPVRLPGGAPAEPHDQQLLTLFGQRHHCHRLRRRLQHRELPGDPLRI